MVSLAKIKRARLAMRQESRSALWTKITLASTYAVTIWNPVDLSLSNIWNLRPSNLSLRSCSTRRQPRFSKRGLKRVRRILRFSALPQLPRGLWTSSGDNSTTSMPAQNYKGSKVCLFHSLKSTNSGREDAWVGLSSCMKCFKFKPALIWTFYTVLFSHILRTESRASFSLCRTF